jgi:hypothetical protein
MVPADRGAAKSARQGSRSTDSASRGTAAADRMAGRTASDADLSKGEEAAGWTDKGRTLQSTGRGNCSPC